MYGLGVIPGLGGVFPVGGRPLAFTQEELFGYYVE